MSQAFILRSELPVSASEAFAWHAREGALERLSPPWAMPELVSREGDLREGRVELRVPTPFGRARWVARHQNYVEGVSFEDEQVEGPFTSWVHRHRFEPLGDAHCALIDDITYTLPLGGIGRFFGGASVEGDLATMFAFRHRRTRNDLLRHRELAGPRLHVAVTGATGLVGRALVGFLRTGGHRVSTLVRRAPRGNDEVAWDPSAGTVDLAALEGLDALVHLAGENIGARWTEARRKAVMSSRVDGTRTLAKAISTLARPPRVWVSGSAVGYYGDTSDREVDESAPPGTGFLSEVCQAWEAEARPAEGRTRLVRARIGVVLTAEGGALAEMSAPIKKGVGGVVGDGKQWTSFIGRDDLIGAILWAIRTESVVGPLNLVAGCATNRELTQTIGAVLSRPTFMPVPGAMIRAMFGEMGKEVLLAGQRVAPRRLREGGFRFDFPELEDLLRFEFGR